jgi:hypothetical protein
MNDTLDGTELIEDGGFESGTMYAYCLCDSSFVRTKPTQYHQHSGTYRCQIENFFSSVQLSQAVNTIAGRKYNVRFWLQGTSFFSFENRATVYMSSAFNTNERFVLLLLKRFIIILLIFYIV